MKTRKEFKKLKYIIRKLEEHQYPGYPFSTFGVVDFKTKDCWTSNGRKNFVTDENWYKFAAQFEAGLLYHILDSNFSGKGNFVIDSYMNHYKVFLDSKWSEKVPNFKGDLVEKENFYIDNQELVRLYFGVWSAIREYQNTDKIMFFVYDGDNEWVEVKLFDTLEEIKNYYKEYFTGED